MEELEQQSSAENLEQQAETQEVEQTEEGGAATPEEVETDEQKNARAQAEEAERRQRREEKKNAGVQRRIDELTAEKYQLKGELEAVKRHLESVANQGKKSEPEDARPKREQFNDYEDYIRADATWVAEQKAQQIINERLGQFEKSQTEKQSISQYETTRKETERAFLERVSVVKREYPDYQDVIDDWEPDLPKDVAEMLVELEEGPLLAYHIAKNPELESKLRNANPRTYGVLLGQTIASLKSSQKVSAAPSPGKPVSSSRAGSANEPPSDPEQYRAWANKHMR